MVRIAFWEADDGLDERAGMWDELASRVAALSPDLLVTNELPFGSWLATNEVYDEHDARASIDIHARGLRSLAALNARSIVTSRPVAHEGKLVNQAILVQDGQLLPFHEKQYFPQEENFFERTWFHTSRAEFDVCRCPSMVLGCLLCTELMFNEWARHYRHLGAQILVVPRASGIDVTLWKTAASMAAIVSGCYVVSSNRRSANRHPADFGGCGFAFEPGGKLIAETSRADPVNFIDVDLGTVERAQCRYPCYVDEITFETNAHAHQFLDALSLSRTSEIELDAVLPARWSRGDGR